MGMMEAEAGWDKASTNFQEFVVWLRELKPVPCDNLEGWDGMRCEGGSCWYMAETNTIL